MIDDARNLWELIERRADATPDAVLGVDEDARRMTFGEYRAAAERAAAGLSALGLGEGAAVSWQLPTWLESIVLVGALSRIGVVQNPILPIYREREVGFVAKQTGAQMLIVPSQWKGFDFEAMARAIAESQPGLEVLIVDRALPDGDPASLPPPPATPADPHDAPIRWAFYTSGTTADPKGARHTDRTIMASAYGMVVALEVEESDRSAMVFPFTHIGGIGWLFAAMMTGCQAVIVEAFDPSTTIPVLQREDVTLAGAGTPFHMAYLAAQREHPDTPLFPNARAYPGGGAAKPAQLHYDVKEQLGGVGVVSGYGLTETPILTMNSVGDPDDKLATTEGRPTPGVELKVVTLDGAPAQAGEEGEIHAKGPMQCKGYLDESLNAEAFDDDGFFRTGDLGFVDADGFVTITGRLKDVIIRKGENISAKEVEDLLFTSPDVADVTVIGLADPRSGEVASAVLVPANPDAPPTLADLAQFCIGAGLMKQKIPEQLEIVDTLPRNATGKVLKHELRKQYAEAVAVVPLPPELKDLAGRVSNWGRWGADDQRGTLNLITPEAVQRGAAAVQTGVSFSLSIPYDTDGPQTGVIPGRINPKHSMLVVNAPFTGDPADFCTSDDVVEMGIQAATHWDALAHVGYEGKLYNDVPFSAVTEDGASKLGIEHFGPIVTRGILLDVARLRGVDYFDDNYAISGDDLAGAAAAAGVTVESGDVVLVRTGQMEWLRRGDKARFSDPSPGLGTRALEWLHDNEVAAIATDTLVFEVWPCEDPAVLLPVHMIDLRDMGLVQGQLWHLDDLAIDCATDGRYTFLLAATPLPITGAVGGAVAPTATK